MVAVRAVAAVAGGILVHLTLGTLYTFGNMTPYLTSYLREYNVTQVTYGESVWIFAASAMGQGTSMASGGFLEQRIGTRLSVLLGSWLASSGVLLTYFSINQSFGLTVVTYGLMFGLGVGIAYAIPMACAMRWLPERKGLVNGMVVAGFGGGAFIFDYVQTGFINPHNLKASLKVDGEVYFGQKSVLDKVPVTFLLLGGVYALLQLIGVLLISNPPPKTPAQAQAGKETSINHEETAGLLRNDVYDTPPATPESDNMADHQIESQGVSNRLLSSEDELNLSSDSDSGLSPQIGEKYTDNEDDTSNRARAELRDTVKIEDSSGLELSPLEVLRNPNFYKLWSCFLINGAAITFISTLYKAYGQTFIKDDLFLAIVGAFAAVFNASGRIFWGKLSDRFSYRVAMMILCGSMAVLMFTLELTSLAGKAMYFIWVCAIFLTFSGNFSLFPTATARSFGQKHIVKNYGLVFTSQVIASSVGAVLSSSLKATLGWGGMFLLVGGLSVVSLFITFTFNVFRKGTKTDI